MKHLKPLLALLFILFMVAIACESDDDEVVIENTIGEVGNYWRMYFDGNDPVDFTIDQNDSGNIVASFDFDGVTRVVEGRITEDGIYDYVYSNGDKGKPFTLVRFDANVGDQWSYSVGDKTVVRKVVRKSTTDDVEYGFFLIKTIDVEETIPVGTMINGSPSEIKEICWKFNHRFGFIEAEVTKTDNSVTTVTSITNAGDE